MDKGAIKTFAVESRRKLMEDVEYKMGLLGIAKDNNHAESISTSEGVETFNIGGSATYSIYDEDIKKRERLIQEVNNKGFENVVEEVAYTWFNRIIAIRFMEVNHYLPSKVRVLSSETPGKIEPDIITEAFNIDLDYSDDDKKLIFKLKDENKLDELFRFLFIKQCNKLNDILPGLFEKTEDYMELLLNISFTNEDGVIRQLIENISEEDFTNQVEIIGWLYQYYISERKDQVINIYKGNVKKEDIPAATQLFTTDWIVKYMVDNSLGRYWIERNSHSSLKNLLAYYLDEADQAEDIKKKLDSIRNESVSIEEIKFFDPCMGSGHILVYAFDVFFEIYKELGYSKRDIPELILKNNLYGLDIDKRAYQLAYFAVLMKARAENRSIFKKNIVPNVFVIQESGDISREVIDYIKSIDSSLADNIEYLIDAFKSGKEFGSLIQVRNLSYDEMEFKLNNLLNRGNSTLLSSSLNKIIKEKVLPLVIQAKLLSYKYECVVTNPPYMNKFEKSLKDFAKKYYKDYSKDLFSMFIYRNFDFCKENGYSALMTPFVWMFIKNYTKLREFIIKNKNISSLIQLEYSAFSEATVPICTFVLGNSSLNYNGIYLKLSEFSGGMNVQNQKVLDAVSSNVTYKFYSNTFHYMRIPGSPIAYWADKHVFEAFEKGTPLIELSDIKQGLATADNNRFLRYWFEVDYHNIGFNYKSCDESKNSNLKWFPYNKGGDFKKWYGNQDFIVNWENDGYEIRNFYGSNGKLKSRPQNSNFYFQPSISWSKVSSGSIAFRYYPTGFLFDVAGCSIFKDNKKEYLMGFLNSSVSKEILSMISPTLNYEVGHISSLPIILDMNKKIAIYVHDNIQICKNDWDDYETSWDFKSHPLLRFKGASLKESFNRWTEHKLNDFNRLKSNETKLNEIFSEIYSIDIDSHVEDKHVSVTKADYKNDIKSFISYAIGCMFGRYSLNEEGLQFAGGNFNINEFNRDIVDEDNIIPVLDTEYFEDDIVGKLVNFVKICFGEESLEENLDFIAGALNSKSNKSSREIIREYLLKDFFKDHSKIYNKRPIYWMFNSGKQNGFSCLVYIHRYEPNLVARVRTDYLHKTQKAIEQNIDRCNDIINSDSKNAKIIKEKNKLEKQLQETREYDEALAHIANQNIGLDLDDGVKMNYAKFQSVEVTREGQKNKTIKLLKNI